MRLPRASREYVSLTVTADIDLAPATLVVSVDAGAFGVWAWTGAATVDAGKWTRTARLLMAGPDATVGGGATVLPLGRHLLTWRLTGIDPEQPSRTDHYIDVV